VGKTALALAAAEESGLNVLHVVGQALISKIVGESEKAIRKLFQLARETAPTIILIDQIEVVAVRRRGSSNSGEAASQGTSGFDRILSTFLTEMDGIKQMTQDAPPSSTKRSSSRSKESSFSDSVIVVATTSYPSQLDPAIIRPGRFDGHVHIPPPDAKARLAILGKISRRIPFANDIDLTSIARRTEGYSAADLQNLCQEAVMIALREDVQRAQEVKQDHVLRATKHCRATLKNYIPEHPGDAKA